MQYKCPKCGNSVQEGANFCGYCGQPFNWPANVTPPSTSTSNPANTKDLTNTQAQNISQTPLEAHENNSNENQHQYSKDSFQNTNSSSSNNKKIPKWLWVILWLFIWPVAAILLILKSDKLKEKKALRIVLIIIVISIFSAIIVPVILSDLNDLSEFSSNNNRLIINNTSNAAGATFKLTYKEFGTKLSNAIDDGLESSGGSRSGLNINDFWDTAGPALTETDSNGCKITNHTAYLGDSDNVFAMVLTSTNEENGKLFTISVVYDNNLDLDSFYALSIAAIDSILDVNSKKAEEIYKYALAINIDGGVLIIDNVAVTSIDYANGSGSFSLMAVSDNFIDKISSERKIVRTTRNEVLSKELPTNLSNGSTSDSGEITQKSSSNKYIDYINHQDGFCDLCGGPDYGGIRIESKFGMVGGIDYTGCRVCPECYNRHIQRYQNELVNSIQNGSYYP